MAAPTNVRVEATSTTTTVLRWSYAGSHCIDVYRSLDSSSYSRVTDSSTCVQSGTTSFVDSGLSPATKYWYKLSDDDGATFSSVVTVWTHVCLDNPDGSEAFALPRFSGEQQDSDQLNNMAQRIEEVLGTRVMEPQQCAKCPVDGALVLDCSSGCKEWIVVADQNINSISMKWCDGGDTNIEFVIPPNTTGRQICGFDSRYGFSGDECFSAPLTSGPNGLTMSVGSKGASGNRANPSTTGSQPRVGRGSGSGGGGGGGACNCVPIGQGVNNLTIKSCNPNNSLNCGTTKSLQLKACGGMAPYTWSKTGTVNLSSLSGPQTTVTPPTNSGSAVVGTAYELYGRHTQTSGGSCLNAEAVAAYGCNDNQLSCTAAVGALSLPQTCNNGNITLISQVPCIGCSNVNLPCTGGGGGQCFNGPPGQGCNSATCTSLVVGGVMCDKRSAGMISGGCTPCGLNSGSTVSVTDALGTVVTVIIRA